MKEKKEEEETREKKEEEEIMEKKEEKGMKEKKEAALDPFEVLANSYRVRLNRHRTCEDCISNAIIASQMPLSRLKYHRRVSNAIVASQTPSSRLKRHRCVSNAIVGSQMPSSGLKCHRLKFIKWCFTAIDVVSCCALKYHRIGNVGKSYTYNQIYQSIILSLMCTLGSSVSGVVNSASSRWAPR